MAMRDSRFGQFADPNFGASLAAPQPTQGVLPAPQGADTSASSDTSNKANTFGMPGLMGQNSNPGSMYLAGGGAIPDDTQDSGDAAPPSTDPFAMISAALQTGRKKFGLPAKFFGGDEQSEPAENDGDEDDVQSFAEGGEVEGEEPEQGVIPDGNTDREEQPQQGGMTPSGNAQGAMAYLSGQGGVGPEIAAALERQVDPQGQMEPSQRKMLAIAQAGDPDKAFQLMQHYRQKFNAYGAFAKAALQGSGGRPPNPAAAADALNKAYEHVPDGKQLRFAPAQGGMSVSIGGGQQQEQPVQSFADGGEVQDDFQYETAGSQTPSGSDYDRAKQASVAQDDYVPGDGFKGALDAITPKRDPSNQLQNFILSIPALLGWQSKDGQFDKSLDKGVDTTLAAAAAAAPQGQPQGQQPQYGSNSGFGWGDADSDVQATGQEPWQQPGYKPPQQQQAPQQAPQQGAPQPQQQAPAPQNTPTDAKQFGAQVGTKGGQEGDSLADVLHEIDQAYPFVGMAQQRALARAAARQHWADNRTKIEAEQTRSTRAENVAKIAGGSRERVADTNQQGRVTAVGMQQEGAGQRNANTVAGRERVAEKAQAGQTDRFNARERNLNDRAVIVAKPGVVGNADKMNEARKGLGPVNQAGGGTQQQPTQGTGPAPTSIPPPGMKYQQSKDGTKWRLVPIQ